MIFEEIEKKEFNGVRVSFGRFYDEYAVLIIIPEQVLVYRKIIAAVHSVEHALINIIDDFMSFLCCVFGDAALVNTLIIYSPELAIIDFVFERIGQIIKDAYFRVKNCKCVNGCDDCIEHFGCDGDNTKLDKEGALMILREMIVEKGSE